MDVYIHPIFYPDYDAYPLILVDVGASGGFPKHWKIAERYLKIIGFEPDEREFSNLKVLNKGEKVRYLNAALYNQTSTVDFHMAKKQQCSSIFMPNFSFLRKFPEYDRHEIVETVKINTDTMDHQFRQNAIDDVDFIKLDTQGSELFILEGGKETIDGQVIGLEIETEFVEMYKDQPLFDDINRFVRKRGFQLFDLRPYYWKRSLGKGYGKPKGQLIFADALYLRDLQFFQHLKDIDRSDSYIRAKLLKSISVCMIYGYRDFALEIAQFGTDYLSDDELRQIERQMNVKKTRSERLPDFWGRRRLNRLLRKIMEYTEKRSPEWAASGKLGNR